MSQMFNLTLFLNVEDMGGRPHLASHSQGGGGGIQTGEKDREPKGVVFTSWDEPAIKLSSTQGGEKTRESGRLRSSKGQNTTGRN